MSSWNTPQPDLEYMRRAWEADPLMKSIVDGLATQEGLDNKIEEYVSEYTPEQNAKYRAVQFADRIKAEATTHATWLQHIDDERAHTERVRETNEAAWGVYRKVLEAQRAGRKTVKIADLMEATNE